MTRWYVGVMTKTDLWSLSPMGFALQPSFVFSSKPDERGSIANGSEKDVIKTR